MPIKIGRIPQGIRSGGDIVRDSLAKSVGGTASAGFVAAKRAVDSWARSGVEDPATQNAPPWFAGRPFTVSRTENPDAYKNWDQAFRNTYSGYEFGAPPPESTADSSNNGKVEPQPMSKQEEA